MNKGTAIVGFFLCFLAGMGLMWGIDRSKGVAISAEGGTEAGSLDHSASPIPVTSKDPSWGNADAPVTIVEISDFQCPFCSRVEPTLKQVEKEYPGKVKIAWKHQPLVSIHPQAMPAALAAEAAREQGKFWQMHDKLFENQGALSSAPYERYARELGLDVQRFKSAYDSGKYRSRVEEDQRLAARLGIGGTPTMVVNGERVVGAVPFEQLKGIIDRKLGEK